MQLCFLVIFFQNCISCWLHSQELRVIYNRDDENALSGKEIEFCLALDYTYHHKKMNMCRGRNGNRIYVSVDPLLSFSLQNLVEMSQVPSPRKQDTCILDIRG